MITTAWLNGITITDKDARVTIDCYGISNGTLLLIESKSYQGNTEIINAWSYANA